MAKVPNFVRRLEWFLRNRPHLAGHLERKGDSFLLAVATRDRLKRLLQRLLDPSEFLSPYGIRSLSKYHQERPYELRLGGRVYRVGYEPAEAETPLFGGNSNWRGPIWFPVNYLLLSGLRQYHKFYGNSLKVPALDGSSRQMNLHEVGMELRRRLVQLFLPDAHGQRPCMQDCPLHDRPGWRQTLWFYEYFQPETGRGLGASHQTGWTALVAPLLEQLYAE